jgi:hypothetical protein
MKDGIWNLLTVLVFAAVMVFILIFGFTFLNPNSALNPLAPPTLPAQLVLPTFTATLKQLPQINTPTPLLSINIPSASSSTPRPSSTPLPTSTFFVLPSATTTSTPTATPTETPTVTPTSTAFQCEIISSFPSPSQSFPPGGDFDGRWTLKNIGSEVWEDNVDLVYRSGTRFQTHADAVDLPNAVSVNGSVEVVIDMLAPHDTGTYESTWSLRKDSNYFCELKIIIKVQ